MYNIDKEKLENIIKDAGFSLDGEKNKQIRTVFLSLMSELCDYSKSVNEKIINQNLQLDMKAILPNICVALMNNEEGNDFGLGLGLAPMSTTGRRIFINDEYENIKLLLGDSGDRKLFEGQYFKDGQCYTFKYYLKFDRTYVEKQEILYKYALQYKLSNPVLFSPFTYKSVMPIYDSELDNEELDFRFNDNGIKAIETTEKGLFWNIILSIENERIYDAKLPYGDEIRYVFEFKKSKRGNYILPLPCNNQVKIFDVEFLDECLRITVDREMDSFTLLEPLTVDETSGIIKTLAASGNLFTNKNSYSGIVNKRLISHADIEHAIAPFRYDNGIKCYVSEKTENIVVRYSSKYKPNRTDRNFFNIVDREYIRFETDNEMPFITDYINYVLEYLEYYYPEIEWVGER